MTDLHDLLSSAGLLMLSAKNAVDKYESEDPKLSAAMAGLAEHIATYNRHIKNYAEQN